MSETWADAQFDMLEAAYSEVPIEEKARIAELESLVCDWCDLYEEPDYGDCIRLRNRMEKLGLLRGDG